MALDFACGFEEVSWELFLVAHVFICLRLWSGGYLIHFGGIVFSYQSIDISACGFISEALEGSICILFFRPTLSIVFLYHAIGSYFGIFCYNSFYLVAYFNVFLKLLIA